jgi:hypothetical protein
MLDLNDNALGDAGVDALYETMLASPRLLKLYVGGNTDVSATAARRVATTVRQRAERERRAALERLKLRATSALSAQRAAQLKAVFTQYDDDADGVVKLSLLPAMYHALGHAARHEQTKELVLQIDRPVGRHRADRLCHIRAGARALARDVRSVGSGAQRMAPTRGPARQGRHRRAQGRAARHAQAAADRQCHVENSV